MKLETISNVPEIQEEYKRMRKKGESHNMAKILALRSPPNSSTEREFSMGCSDPYKYYRSLAKYPGDPEANVPMDRPRAYIKNLCEKRNWACEGMVNVKNRESAPVPAIDVADDLVEERVIERVTEDPSLLEKRSKQDVWEETKDMITPSYRK